jgi:hypothetical protein
MSTTKSPPASMLDALSAEHAAAATHWLSFTAATVRIEVRDATSDEPLPATVRTPELSSTCDPVRGWTQIQADPGATLRVELDGYAPMDVAAAHDEPLRVRLERTAAADRVRVLGGFESASDEAIAITLSSAAVRNVRASRPGTEPVGFECAGGACTAPAAHRRPGHYALTVTLASGGTVTTPNAFYLRDERASADPVLVPTVEGDRVYLSALASAAAIVEHAGTAVPLLRDGDQLSAILPTSGRGIDLVYAYDGALYRIELVADPEESAPVEPTPTSQARACSQSDGGTWTAVVLLSLLAVRRRRRSY